MLSIYLKKSKILIQRSLIQSCGRCIREVIPAGKVLLVSDENVAGIYLKSVKEQLEMIGFTVVLLVVEPGESAKSHKTLEKIYRLLAKEAMSRSDAIVALGGGTVTDVAGFAASTYNRGMNLVHIPTSLMGQVDASIGGKNGVNLSYGKNLVGTIYHPGLVLVDPDVLKTLPDKELCCGIAESIKCACVMDSKLFEMLEDPGFECVADDVIYRSIMVKKAIVEADEFDLGERMLLNFGHTIGHALEQFYRYEKFSHGEAISVGMNLVTRASEAMDFTKKGVADRLCALCEKYSLPTRSTLTIGQLSQFVLRDKKIREDYLHLVMLRDIGNGFIYKVKVSE